MKSKQSIDGFLIKSSHIVLPGQVIAGHLHIAGEKIAAIIPAGDPLPALPVEDAGAAWIFPGLVDTHVHINEPGRTEWEGFETATRAAAAGGITTLVDMPLNSNPVTTTTEALRAKWAAADGKLNVDCGFYAGLVPGNLDQLEALVVMGVLGVKAFMVYSGIPEFPAATRKELEAAMPLLARHRIPLLAHAELDGPVELPPGNPSSYQRYLASRPSSWEVEAISMLIECCKATSCPTHIVHLATADALPMIKKARTSKWPLTVESCPHYLHFCAEEIPDARTEFKCAPPIREKAHREQLWRALEEGAIDMVVSDHSPCTPDLKLPGQGDLMKAWGGISSLQLGLPLILTGCRRRNIPLHHVARWMGRNPAALVGLSPRKGSIEPGADADLVLVDPEKQFTVDGKTLQHRHKVTPYENEVLYGVVEKTYLRGRVVFTQQDGICNPHQGSILHRS